MSAAELHAGHAEAGHGSDTHADHAAGGHDLSSFGLWLYILTDCLLFASLFATYAVLSPATFGGPGPAQLFSLPYVLVETLLLLSSSISFGMVLLGKQQGNVGMVKGGLVVTFLLGLAFVGMEINEFHHLIADGHGPQANAFLSSFFALVGTHGLHVTMGLVWMGALLVQVSRRGLEADVSRRLGLLGIFWHFLDVIWIFVFTFVYLLGAL